MKFILMFLKILTSYQFVWYNIEIDIPLYEDTYEHYEKPYVEVYLNNIKQEVELIYERGVNHTNLNVINSKHVKTFSIDYRVKLLDQPHIHSTKTIKFNIIDITPPTFDYIPEISLPVKTKKLTEKEIIAELLFSDNYYSNDQLIVKVKGLDNVNINKPGLYTIKYEIIDPSLNITEVIKHYEIYNNIPPEIKVKTPIKVEYGTRFDPFKHFVITDEFNSPLEIDFNLEQINFNKLGNYFIYVTAVNSEGYQTNGAYQVDIVDTIKPTLIIEDSLTFNYLEKVNLSNLIKEVKDNYDKLTIDNVNITGYVDETKLGKYEVIYSISDFSNNETIKKVIVEIKDLEKPEIILTQNLVFDVNEIVNNFQQYFQIKDNYNDFEDITVVYDYKNINFNKLGTYFVFVTATDQAKNKTNQQFEVLIVDRISPTVTKNYEEFILIDQFGTLDTSFFLKHFQINDNYYHQNEIILEIAEEINFFKTATLIHDFIFKDPSGNQTIVENVIIKIFESRNPTLELTTYEYKHFIGDETPDFVKFVFKTYDYDNSSDNLQLTILENIDYNQVGLYYIDFIVKSEMTQNQTIKTMKFYVDRININNSTVVNLEVNNNDYIDELAGIYLDENVVYYTVFPKIINTTTGGIKERIIVTYDQRGNIKMLKQVIYVNYQKPQQNYNVVIIANSILIISAIIITIFIKKRQTLF